MSEADEVPIPAPREETDREAIRTVLREGWVGVRELSVRLHLPEKAVAAHLEHVARSARAKGETFHVEPARCSKCGFSFESRERLRKPSRCPSCGSERILAPRFSIA